MVSTITLSGALFLLFKSIFMLWFNTFNTVLYSTNFFSVEYVFPILLLSIGLRLGYGVIKYLFFELKSFINDEEIKNRAMITSDSSFKELFTIINSSGYSLAIFGIIYASVEDIKFLIAFFIIPIIMVIILITKRRSNRRKILSPIRDTLKRIKIKRISIPEWVNICYIFLFVFLISMSLTITSFSSSNQEISIQYKETSEIPVEIILQNFSSPLVSVHIKDSNGNSKHQSIIKHNSYTESYSASIEGNKIENEEDFLSLSDKLTDNVNKFYIPDIITRYYYNINLGELIEDGTYIFEITAVSMEEREIEVKSFSTTIAKEKNKVFIKQKEYISK